jgi:hypothetical protein
MVDNLTEDRAMKFRKSLTVAASLADNFAGGDLFVCAVGRARVAMSQYRTGMATARSIIDEAANEADGIEDVALMYRRMAYEIMSPWRHEFQNVARRIRQQVENTRVMIVQETSAE